MPLVKIFHGNNIVDEVTEKINKIIHNSLEESFQIPQNDTFQLWIKTNGKTNFIDECYLLNSGKRNADFIYIEIFCASGRTIEQKKYLYEIITKKIEKETHLTKTNIFILLNEVPLENWSFGEGIAQMIE